MKHLMSVYLMMILSLFSYSARGESTRIAGAQVLESKEHILVLLHGSEITSLQQVHEILAEAFHFPAYYGHNMDALYDMLTDPQITQKTWHVTILERPSLLKNIGVQNLDFLLETLTAAKKGAFYRP